MFDTELTDSDNFKTTHRRAPATALYVLVVLTVAMLLVGTGRVPDASAEGGDSDATKLAKETQNPVANLISVPFQNNFNFGAGPDNKMYWILNFQPVIPISLNEDWNLITRTITPIIQHPSFFSGTDPQIVGPSTERQFGLGDINPTVFLSPAKNDKFIWGLGPTMTFPTASLAGLGNGKWTAGPSAVGLLMDGPWVVGALVNQQWSFAGWGDKDVNQMLLQPFVNYNLSDGWYLTSAPIMTANWSARSGNHWTVPVGGGVGKLWRIGKIGLPLNTQLAPYYNAVTPDFGPDWQLRFQFQFLFPR